MFGVRGCFPFHLTHQEDLTSRRKKGELEKRQLGEKEEQEKLPLKASRTKKLLLKENNKRF